jgi:hypothetical protein
VGIEIHGNDRSIAERMKSILLIDFENVRNIALGSVPADWHVLIFVGKSQHSIPFEITKDAQQFGDRLQWIKIEGDGRNNLDFHLAFHLGRVSEICPAVEFLVLSKDKGFDPLIRHVVGRGLNCARIERVDRVPRLADGGDPNFDKAFKLLSGIAKNGRPRKRKTLIAQVASFFQKKESVEEITRIVDLLVTKNLVTEVGNTLTYHF